MNEPIALDVPDTTILPQLDRVEAGVVTARRGVAGMFRSVGRLISGANPMDMPTNANIGGITEAAHRRR